MSPPGRSHLIQQFLNAAHQAGVLFSEHLFNFFIFESLEMSQRQKRDFFILFEKLNEAVL